MGGGVDDVRRAVGALQAKRAIYDGYWDYYRGVHPLEYATARLREVFRGLTTHFVENWCAVVVHVPLERLVLERLEVASDAARTGWLQDVWTRLDLDLEVDDAHESLLVTGEAFFIAWPGPTGEPEVFFNDSRLCHAFYEADNPRGMRYAAKWWTAEDGGIRLNLYYADRVEYYGASGGVSDGAAATMLPGAGLPGGTVSATFQPVADPAPNPYGVIPVFHLRSGRFVRSALDDVIPLQAAINKLLADEMVAAEYGAFRQRWVISNADVATLRNAPNEIWSLPAGDGLGQETRVGEFGETPLSNYEASIERRVAAVSAITRIPPHYFFRSGQPPSGEALMVLEAPLNKRIRRLQHRLAVTWQELAAFVLALGGQAVGPNAIRVVYAAPETVQPRTAAEIRQLTVAAGVPLVTQLRREGWGESELEQLRADLVRGRDLGEGW